MAGRGNIYQNIKRVGRFKSGAEYEVMTAIGRLGYGEDSYEAKPMHYTRTAKYIPDFYLDENHRIEVKGMFPQTDRAKMKSVKLDNPEVNILILFSNPEAKIQKGSKTTYGMWCERNGFPFGSVKTAYEDVKRFLAGGMNVVT